MRRTWFCGLVVVGLLAMAAAPAARAGDKPAADEPTVVIRVKSLDTVLQNLKLLATLLGREEAAQDIQGLIKAKVGAKGLQGIDLGRPVGAYVRFGKELGDFAGTLLVPVADAQAFLTLLENVGVTSTKGKDDIYTLQSKLNIDLYLRFAKKYAYVSVGNTDNLSDKNLLDPAKVLAVPEDSLISATVRLDQVPDFGKLLASDQLAKALQELQDKVPPPETEAQKQFAKAAVGYLAQTVADAFKDGQRVRLDVALDKDRKDLAVRMSLSAMPGTELAKAITTAGKSKSAFAGLMSQNAAFRGSVDTTFPPELHKAFARAIEDAAAKGIADMTDAPRRKQAQALVDALLPTVKAGQLDAFFGMAGPVGSHYTLLAAVKVKDGDELGAVVHKLVTAELKTMPAEQRDKIQLDVDTVGAIKIHKFELPRDPKTNKVLEDLPGDPNLFVAFRKDAVFLAIGPQSLATLKSAVAADATDTVPVFLFDFNVAHGWDVGADGRAKGAGGEAVHWWPGRQDPRGRRRRRGADATAAHCAGCARVLREDEGERVNHANGEPSPASASAQPISELFQRTRTSPWWRGRPIFRDRR